MKYGLWFLSAAALAGVGTVLAASLPVPPSLPRIATQHAPPPPAPVAAAPAPATPAEPATPPAAPRPQVVATPPAAPPPPAVERPKRVAAAPTAAHSTDPSHTAKRPTRHVAKAMPERHPRAVAHTALPRYAAVPKPLPPYPGMPLRQRTHVAMAPPPPYGMPAPYWRMPYPPDY